MKVIADNDAIEYLKGRLAAMGKENVAVRFNAAGFGWGGPEFNIVLDEQRVDDASYELDGVKFVVEGDYGPFLTNVKVVKTNYGVAIDGLGGGC